MILAVVLGGIPFGAPALGAQQIQDGTTGPRASAGLPYLCLTLLDETELREGLQVTRVPAVSFGSPVAYNEVPSSLVSLGAARGPVPLPGRHPVGLRVSRRTGAIEILDRNRAELVQVRKGTVGSARALGVEPGDTLVAAVWDVDRWHVLLTSADQGWMVRTFTTAGTPLAVRSVPLPEADYFRVGTVGRTVVLVEFDSPHRVFGMDPVEEKRWQQLGEVTFNGAASGRTVPLPPLAIDNLALITLVDQGSAARTVRLLDIGTGEFRDSRIDVPMAFISVDPTGSLYAIREIGGRELLRYSWSLSERA